LPEPENVQRKERLFRWVHRVERLNSICAKVVQREQ
jgi:hypothetical protein